jgi:hypothetical protein
VKAISYDRAECRLETLFTGKLSGMKIEWGAGFIEASN